jgi:hypothetical protein
VFVAEPHAELGLFARHGLVLRSFCPRFRQLSQQDLAFARRDPCLFLQTQDLGL